MNEEKLRFDFSHSQALTPAELQAIEDLVNKEIRRNSEVQTELLDYDTAVERGAMALFGEKYGDQVRVLTMGNGYSVELCGGTHVGRTGDIGLLRITSETGIAAGVRRIEAVTGAAALAQSRQSDVLLDELAGLLKSNRADLAERVTTLLAENKILQKELSAIGQKLAANQGSDLASTVVEIGGIKFLAAEVQGDNKAMMQTLDTLRSQLGDAIIVLACVENGKVGLVVGVGKSITEQIKAPEILSAVGSLVGVKGGGRPDMARAGGGDNPAGLVDAFAAARDLVTAKVGS